MPFCNYKYNIFYNKKAFLRRAIVCDNLSLMNSRLFGIGNQARAKTERRKTKQSPSQNGVSEDASIVNSHDSSDNLDKKDSPKQVNAVIFAQPELAYHALQSLLFAVMATTTLRMKYLWTPHLCVLAGVTLCHPAPWKWVLCRCRVSNTRVVQCLHVD